MIHNSFSQEAKFTKQEAWKYGVLASVCVALCGISVSALISFILRKKTKTVTKVTKIMVIFAAGALIGDAFIHLIGDAWSPIEAEAGAMQVPEQASSHYLSLICLSSFILFMLIERSLHLLGIQHSHGVDERCKKHHKSDIKTINKMNYPHLSHQGHPQIDQNLNQQQSLLDKIDKYAQSNDDEEEHSERRIFGSWHSKKPEGWMVMVADFSHVILDGLAIGVAYSSGNKHLAISTFVAVLAHEIPSRTGRTAILLHANFSPVQTVLCNGVANVAAVLGAVIGLVAGEVNPVLNKYLVSFVIGNFVYISLIDMLPYMIEGTNNKMFLFQLIAFIAGIASMYFVLIFEN